MSRLKTLEKNDIHIKGNSTSERQWVEPKSMYTAGVHTKEDYHKYICTTLIFQRLTELGYMGDW